MPARPPSRAAVSSWSRRSSSAWSAPNQPIHCGSEEAATVGSASPSARRATSSSPSPRAMSAWTKRWKMESVHRSSCAAREMSSRFDSQSPASNAIWATVSIDHSCKRAIRRGTLWSPSRAVSERFGSCDRRGPADRPGSSRHSRGCRGRLRRGRYRSRAAAGATPSSTSPSAIRAIPSVFRTSPSACGSRAAPATASAASASSIASRNFPRRNRIRASHAISEPRSAARLLGGEERHRALSRLGRLQAAVERPLDSGEALQEPGIAPRIRGRSRPR